jgi:hypothetical protein
MSNKTPRQHFAALADLYKHLLEVPMCRSDRYLPPEPGLIISRYDEDMFKRFCSDLRMEPVWKALTKVPEHLAIQFLFRINTARHSVVYPDVLEETNRTIELSNEIRTVVRKMLRLIERAKQEDLFFPKEGEIEIGKRIERQYPFNDNSVSWLRWLDGYLERHIRWNEEILNGLRAEISRKLSALPHTMLLLKLVEVMVQTFGRPRYELVAALASVILGANVDAQAARAADRRNKQRRPIRP